MSGAVPAALLDRHGRIKRKLRVSLTDRCNLRCHYCMPDKPQWLPRAALMQPAELQRLVGLFVRTLGISELRLTGGEPLLRTDLAEVIAALGALRTEGLRRIALTSNGVRLAPIAAALREAGLDDLNVSLDAITPARFTALTRGEVAPVLAGIEAAQRVGLPTKLNCVVIRDANEAEIVPLARWAEARGLPLRYIEFMPLDGGGRWSRERVVDEAEILAALRSHWPALAPLPQGSDPARYYALDESGYRIGVISTVSRPFCASCDRLRLDARGQLYTCLFSATGTDLLTPLRAGAGDEELVALIRTAVLGKPAGYAAQPGYVERPITMHHLGG